MTTVKKPPTNALAAALRAAREDEPEQPAEIPDGQPSDPPEVETSGNADTPTAGILATRKGRSTEVGASELPNRRVGRPPGRKSDPNFTQMTAYVAADVHEELKMELLLENGRRRRQGLKALDMSDVVEEQIRAWLAERKGSRKG